MTLDVLDVKGKKTGRVVNFPDEIFAAAPKEHTVYLAVKQYLAAQRQGTHKVKTRGEVHGASRKLHRQKGTGGSRKGNLRNPLYKGGGTVFGPKPRGYGFKLNKKVKDWARISLFSDKMQHNAALVLEDINFETPNTKSFYSILQALNIQNKKSLFLVSEHNEVTYMSSRNIPNAAVAVVDSVSVYELINADVIVFAESVKELFIIEEAVANA